MNNKQEKLVNFMKINDSDIEFAWVLDDEVHFTKKNKTWGGSIVVIIMLILIFAFTIPIVAWIIVIVWIISAIVWGNFKVIAIQDKDGKIIKSKNISKSLCNKFNKYI